MNHILDPMSVMIGDLNGMILVPCIVTCVPLGWYQQYGLDHYYQRVSALGGGDIREEVTMQSKRRWRWRPRI